MTSGLVSKSCVATGEPLCSRTITASFAGFTAPTVTMIDSTLSVGSTTQGPFGASQPAGPVESPGWKLPLKTSAGGCEFSTMFVRTSTAPVTASTKLR